MTSKYLSNYEKQKRVVLRQLPLKKLPLKKSGLPIHNAIQKIKKELIAKGIQMEPVFWISKEWFCPDGVCGVAIPFYLFNPSLQRMEKENTGLVEGETYDQILKLLRHEIGHAFENLYGTRQFVERKKVFGSSNSKPYPSSYEPQLYSQKYIKHLGEAYAQSHPDEDFAETFAVWMSQSLVKIKRTYKKYPQQLEKLLAVERIVTEAISRGALASCKFNPFEPLNTLNDSLAQYYSKKRLQQKYYISAEAKKLIKQTAKNQKIALNSKISKSKKANCKFKINQEMIQDVCDSTGLRKYQVQKILKPFTKKINSTLSNNSNFSDFKKQRKELLLDLITIEVLEGLRLKKNRVYL